MKTGNKILLLFAFILVSSCGKNIDERLEGNWTLVWTEGIDSTQMNSGEFYRTGIKLGFRSEDNTARIVYKERSISIVEYQVNWQDSTILFSGSDDSWISKKWDLEYWNERIPRGKNEDIMILSNDDKEIHMKRVNMPAY